MEIQQLTLRGFKKYRSQTFDFTPGLNLIVGPNEAGKTTLHQAIVTALYGLGKRSAMLIPGKQEAHHWFSRENPELEIQFVLREKTYRIIRNLGTGDALVQLLHARGNTDEILAQTATDALTVLTTGIGIPDAGIFNQTVSIHQGQLAHLEDLAGVGRAIEQVFSGQDEVDMATVLERLKQFRKMLKKTRNEKPGRIDVIQARITHMERVVATEMQAADVQTQLVRHVAELEQLLPTLKKEVEATQEHLTRFEEKRKLLDQQEQRRQSYAAAEKRLQHLMTLQAAYEQAQKTHEQYALLATDEAAIEAIRGHIEDAARLSTELEQEKVRRQSSRESITVLLENRILYVQPLVLVGILAAVLLGLFMVWIFETWAPSLIAVAGAVWFVVELWRWRQLNNRLEGAHKSKLEITLEQTCEQHHKQNAAELQHYHLDAQNWNNCRAFAEEILTYRASKEGWQKAEAALQAGMADESLAKVTAERDNLLFESSTIAKSLEGFDGFAPTTAEVEEWRDRLVDLGHELPRLEKDLNHSRGKLQGAAPTSDALTAKQAELDYLRTEFSRLGQRYLATCLALERMEGVVADYHGMYLPALEKRVSEYFKTLTHGRYTKVLLVDSWPSPELHMSEKKVAKTSELSSGTLDQLYLALRMSAADLLTKDDRLLLIMDDPFVNFDKARLAEALRLVAELATTRQILLMTTDRQFESVVESIANPNVIELKS